MTRTISLLSGVSLLLSTATQTAMLFTEAYTHASSTEMHGLSALTEKVDGVLSPLITAKCDTAPLSASAFGARRQ